MLYLIPLLLQAYCIYHCIKNRNEYYWFFVIFFLPVLGSIVYLITQVYSRRDAAQIGANLTQIINPTKKVKDLERQLDFSDTYQNRVNLADAYLEIGDYDAAITHYENALEGNFQNDFYVIKNMIEAFYKKGDFAAIVTHAPHIQEHNSFKASRTQFIYGLALKEVGRIEDAEANLQVIDVRFSFYEERLIYAKFLIDIGKPQDAKAVLEALITEGRHMTTTNKRMYRKTIAESQQLLNAM